MATDQKEKRSHGTARFPVGYYYVDGNHPRYVMVPHWHPEHELMRVISGSMELSLSGAALSVRAGDIVFCAGGTLHAGKPDDCVYECIVFSPEKMLSTELLSTAGENKPTESFAAEKDGLLYRLASSAFELLHRPDTPELAVEGALISVGGLAARRGASGKRAGSRGEDLAPVGAVLRYMGEHYGEKLGLAELSRAAGMSPAYFCRYFARVMRTSPIEYLNNLRVRYAKDMLASTDEKIVAVANACGFSSASYFVCVFRKYEGKTPNAYREAIRAS